MELPRLPDGTFPEMTDAERRVYFEAVDKAITSALTVSSDEEAAKIYRAFIDKYPLAPDTPPMMCRLAVALARQEKFDEARKALESAKLIVGDDRYVNVLDIHLAHVDMLSGKLDSAQRRLLTVMNKPLPESFDDPYRFTPQIYGAPLSLARLHALRKEPAEAYRVLREMSDRAEAFLRQDQKREWARSYLINGYFRQIVVMRELEPDQIGRARQLQRELLGRLDGLGVDRAANQVMIDLSDLDQELLKWQWALEQPPAVGK